MFCFSGGLEGGDVRAMPLIAVKRRRGGRLSEYSCLMDDLTTYDCDGVTAFVAFIDVEMLMEQSEEICQKHAKVMTGWL